MSTSETMNALIRAAARQDAQERAPQPATSTPSDQHRPSDINAATTGYGMPVGDANANSRAHWMREHGYGPAPDITDHMRALVAQKRAGGLGGVAGWR